MRWLLCCCLLPFFATARPAVLFVNPSLISDPFFMQVEAVARVAAEQYFGNVQASQQLTMALQQACPDADQLIVINPAQQHYNFSVQTALKQLKARNKAQ